MLFIRSVFLAPFSSQIGLSSNILYRSCLAGNIFCPKAMTIVWVNLKTQLGSLSGILGGAYYGNKGMHPYSRTRISAVWTLLRNAFNWVRNIMWMAEEQAGCRFQLLLENIRGL
ncbi:hypothetical protein J1N35_024446 [Gossypium stocksii]|uniref:Uncharacterized protein n=1 Tax=Gossypium stocksii TaxID=47602 RepID=A0A9D3V7G5_9ROSI|nr:hypothetical protein J1N35_024446 [Gossypium stocksii]